MLMERVAEILADNHYVISNVDSTIIAQKPKMAPHIQKMRENIANALGIEIDRVSVKATTEEGLGFTGEGLGISAQAVVLITKVENIVYDDIMNERSSCCSGCNGCPKTNQ